MKVKRSAIIEVKILIIGPNVIVNLSMIRTLSQKNPAIMASIKSKWYVPDSISSMITLTKVSLPDISPPNYPMPGSLFAK